MNRISLRILFFILVSYSCNYAMEMKDNEPDITDNVFEDYYAILGVSTHDTKETIAKKFNTYYKKIYPELIKEKKIHDDYDLKFRKSVIAYLVLTDDTLRGSYSNNPSSFVEPYALYTLLNVPLKIPENAENPSTPPYKITSENASQFFTQITRETIARAFLDSRAYDEQLEKEQSNAFEILSDTALRRCYDAHPTKTIFTKEDSLKYEKVLRKESKESKVQGSFRKSLTSLGSFFNLIKKDKAHTVN